MKLYEILEEVASNQWISCENNYESIVWKEGVDIPSKESIETYIYQFKEAETKKQKELTLKKLKENALEDLNVNLNNVAYDANFEGLTNLGVVLGGMSLKLLQKMAQQSSENQALYDEVFNENIAWKGADNKMHNVKIESLVKVLQKALENKSQILMDSVE